MPDRPHNARDGRCRYTWGAERCPAPGAIAVGRWWVCAEHREWAHAPADPLFAEEGRRALRVQQRRYGSPGATSAEEVGSVATKVAPTGGSGGGGGERSREAALRAIRAVLGVEVGDGDEDGQQRSGVV